MSDTVTSSETVAVVGCGQEFGGEHDEAALHDALRGLGVGLELVRWDDLSVDWRRYDAALIRTLQPLRSKPLGVGLVRRGRRARNREPLERYLC